MVISFMTCTSMHRIEVISAQRNLFCLPGQERFFCLLFLCLYGKMNEIKCNLGRNDMKTISTLEKINHLLTEQFAIDYGCTVEDF